MKIERDDHQDEQHILDEIMILLEEKKISLSFIRTGIMILSVQLFVISFLIAASRFYKFMEVMHMIIPFYIINVFLFLLGLYLIISALIQITSYNRAIFEYKKKSQRIKTLME